MVPSRSSVGDWQYRQQGQDGHFVPPAAHCMAAAALTFNARPVFLTPAPSTVKLPNNIRSPAS